MSARSLVSEPTRVPLRGVTAATSMPAAGEGAASLAMAIDALRRRGGPLRVWCAGSSSVIEPLSVLLLTAAVGLDVELIATVGASQLADAGRLQGRWLRLPRAVVGDRLVGDRRGFAPTPELMARWRVAAGGVADVPAGGPFDLIVCRDVLHRYRPGVADSLLRGLVAAADREGVVVVAAVDALAAGRPLPDSEDVLLWQQPGRAGDVEAFVDDEGAHPTLQLAALLDPTVDVPRRAGRLLRLMDRAPSLEEARLAAAAVALADGQAELARRLLEQPVSIASEGDASTLLAIAALRAGDHHAARALLARAQPTSWLAPYLLGRLARRLQRDADAAASFRLALGLLDGNGVAPAGSGFIDGCAPAQAAAHMREALRGAAAAWHGP